MRRRYQTARNNPVLPIPLAGVSGENGTLMVAVHRTSDGSWRRLFSSMAKSQAPFKDCQPDRCSCGLGPGEPIEARGMRANPEQTAIHHEPENRPTPLRLLLRHVYVMTEAFPTQIRLTTYRSN